MPEHREKCSNRYNGGRSRRRARDVALLGPGTRGSILYLGGRSVLEWSIERSPGNPRSVFRQPNPRLHQARNRDFTPLNQIRLSRSYPLTEEIEESSCSSDPDVMHAAPLTDSRALAGRRGCSTLHTQRAVPWQEARLTASEAAGSRPYSRSRSLRSWVAHGAEPVTAVTAGRNSSREFRRRSRRRIHAGHDRSTDNHPPALILPWTRRGTARRRVELGLFETIIESIFGTARSEHLAAAAALDALQRGLDRSLGAVPQRFGRRAPSRLDQCHGRQPVPSVVLHVRSGVQQRPERQRLPRFLHALGAAEPSPGADHQRPLRPPKQCRQRLADPEPEQSDGDGDDEEPHRDSAISRSRPASCCTRRRTSRSQPKWPCWPRPAPSLSRGTQPPWSRPSDSGTTSRAVG